MRMVRVTIGIDWKSTKSGKCDDRSFFPTSAMSRANGTQNYNSDRHSISLSADLESSDALEDVEKRLYGECCDYLAKVISNGRVQPAPAPTKTISVSETPDPAPAVEKEQEETKAAVEEKPIEGSDPKDDKGYAQSIIDEHRIRSLAHAGWLRSQKKITYPQWKVVHQYLSDGEIAEAEA